MEAQMWDPSSKPALLHSEGECLLNSKGRIVDAFFFFPNPSSAPFSPLNVHLGFKPETRHEGIVWLCIPIYLTEAAAGHPEWTCMCLPSSRPHTSVPSPAGLPAITNVDVSYVLTVKTTGNWPIPGRIDEGMQSYRTCPKNWAALFDWKGFFSFFLKCLSWYFCIKVTRLSLGTLFVCMCVAHIA